MGTKAKHCTEGWPIPVYVFIPVHGIRKDVPYYKARTLIFFHILLLNPSLAFEALTDPVDMSAHQTTEQEESADTTFMVM
jgi:hypothetical protein